jgi:hypothetical protein
MAQLYTLMSLKVISDAHTSLGITELVIISLTSKVNF